ncbi:MAG: HNH endonuclease family protein, partial [Pseudomonadota bacterium]
AHRRGEAVPYFLGCCVFVKSAGDPQEHIVDGHQRLTTLTILLALLRDLDAEEGAALDRHIRAAPERAAPRLAPRGARGDPAARFRGVLRVRPLDTVFFERAVQTRGATLDLSPDTPVENDAQARILAVTLAFREAMTAMEPVARRRLAEYILRSCYLVEVTAPYQDQAFQIFSVMNGRGKDLTDADLLKADLMAVLPPDQRHFYAQIWEGLEASLGQAAFLQLFGHIRMIHTPKKAKSTVAFELRETLNPAASPKAFIERELEPKGRAFAALSGATLNAGAKSAACNRLLRALHRIRNKDWLPPAIAYFADRRPAGDDALAFLTALDRAAYALFITGADENTRIARFRPVIEALRDDRSAAELTPLLLERLALTPNEKKQARQVLGGPIFQKERIRTAVLLRIDEHLADEGASYDINSLSVEHILPQNPPPQSPWLESWPNAADRTKWTHRLGNLALLSRERNQEARNLDFQRKLQEYFTKDRITPCVITAQLLIEPEWTPAAAAKRQEKLFSAACEIWDL